MTSHDPSLRVRRTTADDRTLLWEWANDPGVRGAAFRSQPIAWDEHCAWFERTLRDPRCHHYVVMDATGTPVGQVRFDIDDGGRAEVDVSVARGERGKRYAAPALRLACDEVTRSVSPRAIVAHVKPENVASLRAFARAGFDVVDHESIQGQDAVRLERRAPAGTQSVTARYVVAAAHAWNRQVFETVVSKYPGDWTFVDRAEALTPAWLASIEPRYVFFMHWSHRVPDDIVNGYECIGFHMTDLPYGRGGSPLQNLIVRGHRTTKLSAFRLTDALDAGPIYAKEDLSLDGSAQEIYGRAATLAARMIGRIVRERIEPVPQTGEPVIFKRRTPAQSRIGDGVDLETLYDLIRMLDADGYPRAFLEHGGLRFQFSGARLADGELMASVTIQPIPKDADA